MDSQAGPAADVGYAAAVRRAEPRLSITVKGLLAILAILLAVSGSVQARTVADQASFYAALADSSVTVIQLTKNVAISIRKGPGAWPLVLGRSVLIEGDGSYPRLDFNFASNDRVALGAGVTLTFRALILVDTFSRDQLACNFFASSPASSTISWQDVIDWRSLCQPLDTIRAAWTAAPRPADAGGTQQSQQQLVSSEPFCIGGGGCSVRPVMRSSDVVVGSPAGYRIRLNNTLTVCDQFISQACIQDKGVDLCYLNSIESLMGQRMLEGQQEDVGTGGTPSGGGSGSQTGIIAGCVVGGVALLALVVGCLICRRRSAAAMDDKRVMSAAATFDPLDPEAKIGVIAYASQGGASASASAQADSTMVRAERQISKLASSKALMTRAEARNSHDTSDSTDVRPSLRAGGVAATAAVASAAALGSGSSLRTSIQGTQLQSGSGAQADAAASTSFAASQQQQNPQAAGSTTQSVSSVVVAMLKSIIGRGSNNSERAAAPMTSRVPSSVLVAAPLSGLIAPGSPAHAGGPSGARVLTTPVTSSSFPRRQSLQVNNDSAPGSSTGQAAGRPSMGEMQKELERMEGQLMKGSKAAKAGITSSKSLDAGQQKLPGKAKDGHPPSVPPKRWQ